MVVCTCISRESRNQVLENSTSDYDFPFYFSKMIHWITNNENLADKIGRICDNNALPNTNTTLQIVF